MRLVLVIALVSLWSGCASMPRTGVRATGQPLRIVEDVKVWRQRDNVGEVRVEDQNGQRLATADVYATQTHTKWQWHAEQGGEPISDEDFFRITGQPRAAEESQRWHERNVRANHRGRWLLIGGVVGAIAGLAMPGIQAKALMAITGISVGSCGLYLMLWSSDKMQEHVVPVWDANELADRYNRKHGLSVSRSF
jgi:hypothetical protein